MHLGFQHKVKAQTVGVGVVMLCVVGIMTISGCKIWLSSCKQKVYCLKDDDGNPQSRKWCQEIKSKNELIVNGWKKVSGPYDSTSKCDTNCWLDVPNVPPPKSRTPEEEKLQEKEFIIHGQESFDGGLTWRDVHVETNSMEFFNWQVMSDMNSCQLRLKFDNFER